MGEPVELTIEGLINPNVGKAPRKPLLSFEVEPKLIFAPKIYSPVK